MPLTPAERQRLRKACTTIVPGFAALSPAQEFQKLSAWCEANHTEHDLYGEGEMIQALESKIAALMGKTAAVFMPSGIMAQLIALRIWTEAAKLPRFGLHPTSHLLLHEEQAHEALLQCHGVPVGDRLRPMLASDLEAQAQPLACLLVELPIREAGGQLPSWDELEALKIAALQRGVPLHMDGARLWESAAFYGKSYADICTGFGSVYVSLYKGIGALSGAMLAGDADFVAQARLWRRRMGGTLFHLSPMVASAAMRLDERLALMPQLYQRTLDFAAGLQSVPALRVNPRVPQANMLHLFFDAPAEAVLAARDALASEAGCWLVDTVRPAEVPGWSRAEIYIGDRLLLVPNATVVPLFVQLAAASQHGLASSPNAA